MAIFGLQDTRRGERRKQESRRECSKENKVGGSRQKRRRAVRKRAVGW